MGRAFARFDRPNGIFPTANVDLFFEARGIMPFDEPRWGFQLEIKGQANERARIETSSDLRTWAFVREIVLDSGENSQMVGLISGDRRFYRVALAR